MKRKGNKSDFTAERNAELRAAFFSQGVYSTCDEVMKKTVRMPASRFWTDPERARDVLSRIEKDPEAIAGMKPERQRMYSALYERYKSIRRQCPGESKISCATMAIYSGSPEFFLTPATVRSIIYNKCM